MTRTLYERLGGEAAVLAAVGLFYEKVTSDPMTRPWFSALDIAAQTRKQVAFMTWAFGGPAEYKGRDLRAAHAPLVDKGLDDQHFDAVLGHLESTLRDLDVEPELIADALAIVGKTRADVLNR